MTAWYAFMGWTLVVVGWIVVFYGQRYKDHRDAIRGATLQCEKDIAELRKSAISYHSSPRDQSKERDLLFDVQRIVNDVQMIAGEMGDKGNRPRDICVRLRQSITRNHFHSDHQSPLGPTDPVLGRIDEAVFETRQYVREIYRKTLSYNPIL